MNMIRSRLAAALMTVLTLLLPPATTATAQNADQQQTIEAIMQRLSETDNSDLQAFEDGYKEAIACCPDTNLVHEAYMRLNNLWLYGFEPPKQTERIALAEQYLLTYGDSTPVSADMINTLTATYGDAGQHDKLAKLYDPYFATPPKPFPLDQYEAHRFSYADALDKSGRTAEALTQYKTVVSKGEVMDFLLRIAGERVDALEGDGAAQAASPGPDEPLPPDPAIPGEPEYDQGLTAFTQKHYAEALQYFDTAARAGNTGAQYSLGMMFYKGLGTPVDMAEAATWFAKAEAKGHPRAATMLASAQAKAGTSTPLAPTHAAPAASGIHKAQAILNANGVDITFPVEWTNPEMANPPFDPNDPDLQFVGIEGDVLESRPLNNRLTYFAAGASEPYTGLVLKRDGNGKPSLVEEFKNGIPDGVQWEIFYKRGSSEEKYFKVLRHLVDGSKQGPTIMYREDGRPYNWIMYEVGRKKGSHFGWHPDGELQLWAVYDNSRHQGPSMELYENGNPRFYLEYKNGRQEGLALFFYEDGSLKSRQTFKQNKCIGPKEEFGPDGSPTSTVPCLQ